MVYTWGDYKRAYPRGSQNFAWKAYQARMMKRNAKLKSKPKYAPAFRTWQSRSLRSRQLALRKMSRSKSYVAKNALKAIRSKAKYNNYKLMQLLKARSVIRRGVRRWKDARR